MMKKLILTLLLVLFPISFALSNNSPSLEGQQSDSPIIFIVDGSGSMWGKVQNEFKIVVARTVMKDLVGNIPTERPLGLVVYGHRKKGDCSDVEYKVKPAPNSQSKITQTLEDINPTGKTPLAVSAKMVIDDLKANNAKATIILVTDGIETCEGDLCELVADAQKNGIEFKMHIVGFDLEPEAREALECAANAGQGQYFDATNSEELGEALNNAVEEDIDNDDYNLTVRATREGTLVDTWVRVYDAATNEEAGGCRTYAADHSNPCKILLEPGTYNIEARLLEGSKGVFTTLKNVVIPAEGIVEQSVDFSTGKLSTLVTHNGELWDATVKITDPATGKVVGGGRTYYHAGKNPNVSEIPPGTYNVEIMALKVQGTSVKQIFENVVVQPAQTAEVSHNYETGIIIHQSCPQWRTSRCHDKNNRDYNGKSGGRK